MRNIFANITQKGTEAHFHQAMDAIPTVWQNHVMTWQSTAASEQLVWPGFLPAPKEFISGRDLVGIRDFTYTVENKEYELSFIIDRNSVEDDQHGAINARIQEAAEVWATFKDSQFATLLINGESTTLGIDTLDSTSFHNPSRTIGDSGTIDNTETTDIDPVNEPTPEEILTALQGDIAKMARYNDDTGRPFNSVAMRQKRAIIPPEHERAFTEAMNSTQVVRSSAGVSNPWGEGLCEIDVLPYLTDADNAYYLSFLGASRKPFIYQERTPLEIIVYNDAKDIAKNHGVLVLTRQRYRLGYGDPRRNLRHDFT
jgi:phage major head subunit gpT-like protein